MTEFEQDLAIVAGDSRDYEVEVLDEDGVPVNITGLTVNWALADDEVGTTTLAEHSTAPGEGIEITDGTHGIFTLSLDPEDTEDLHGLYYHEAQIDDGTAIYTVLKGRAYIYPSIIKAVVP